MGGSDFLHCRVPAVVAHGAVCGARYGGHGFGGHKGRRNLATKRAGGFFTLARFGKTRVTKRLASGCLVFAGRGGADPPRNSAQGAPPGSLFRARILGSESGPKMCTRTVEAHVLVSGFGPGIWAHFRGRLRRPFPAEGVFGLVDLLFGGFLFAVRLRSPLLQQLCAEGVGGRLGARRGPEPKPAVRRRRRPCWWQLCHRSRSASRSSFGALTGASRRGPGSGLASGLLVAALLPERAPRPSGFSARLPFLLAVAVGPVVAVFSPRSSLWPFGFSVIAPFLGPGLGPAACAASALFALQALSNGLSQFRFSVCLGGASSLWPLMIQRGLWRFAPVVHRACRAGRRGWLWEWGRAG